jgi:D-glycero-D-manno-heptose 1,7-bisphosphate phosphatase
MGERAVFLDRDGVLVVPDFRDGRSFAPRSLEGFRLYDDAARSAQRLKQAGYKLVVVTNQPDVGNGLVERSVIEQMNAILLEQVPLDAIEVCYHKQSDNCDCRKPKPGMLRRAAERLGIDCRQSVMVGDRSSDIAAGRAAGCATVFIDLHYNEPRPDRPDFVVSSFDEATDVILAMKPYPIEQGASA